ncbi:hypothetical protein GGI08_001819 [Coemansia sp. S2]|nr:hypothetical protein GGI08_001819 [Coemansia sp. S2]KAJ2076126.1 hypothetical protein GGH13_000111 [Coemansia sp. S155-1]
MRVVEQRAGPRDQFNGDTRMPDDPDSQRPNAPLPIGDRPPTKRQNTATLRVAGKAYFRLCKRAMKKAI